jgi:hypothetical protein
MPCLVGCLALGAPRVALLLVFLFSDYLGRAYETNLWPFLGFFFAPLTTLAYAGAINEHGSVDGIWLVVVILAAALDLGLIRLGSPRRRRPGNPGGRTPGGPAAGGPRTIDVGGGRVG